MVLGWELSRCETVLGYLMYHVSTRLDFCMGLVLGWVQQGVARNRDSNNASVNMESNIWIRVNGKH